MASNKGRRLVGAIIVLIGAVLLIAAAFMPWYSYEVNASSPAGSSTTTQNSYPGFPGQNGTIQYSCSGTYSSCPSQNSYTGLTPAENNTGNIAETGYLLLIVGFLVSIIGFIFGMMSRNNPRRASPAMILAVLGMILALITPILFAVSLPGALTKDIPSQFRAGSGPWGSFIGSNTSTPFPGVTVKTTWGPAIGWYLSFGAFVILLIGMILLWRYRKDPAEPAPTTVPAPGTPSSTATSGAPPTGPPS